MDSKLVTTWGEHESAVPEILSLASRTLRIFDADLSMLRLEHIERIAALRNLLGRNSRNIIQIVVRETSHVRNKSPRLLDLLSAYTHQLAIIECPQQLSSLSDSMMIADGKHALIRFHKDHARAKVIIDNITDCLPYTTRFEDILAEGGELISGSTLGL